jgi:hypothetical protein
VTPPSTEPKIGDLMSDGTIYAGISPETDKPMYTTRLDASLTMTFNEAADYAAKLDAHGHRDWHVPTKSELNVLFDNRVSIAGFNVTGSGSAAWYWSSTASGDIGAWCQRLSDGLQEGGYRTDTISLRCVRTSTDGEVLTTEEAQAQSTEEIQKLLRRKAPRRLSIPRKK